MQITQDEINEIITDFYQLNRELGHTYDVCKDYVLSIMHEVGMLDDGYELSWSQDTFADAFWEISEEYRVGEIERRYDYQYDSL